MDTIVIKTILNLIASSSIAVTAHTKFRRANFPVLKITSSVDYHKDVKYIAFYNKTKKNLFSETFELSHLIIKYKGVSIFDKSITDSVDVSTFEGHKYLKEKDTTFSNFIQLHNFFDYEHKPVN